jgi:hypothetical protein
MAIISIPSSIGGVTIPGSLIDGPLGALFGSKYNTSNYQYPRDLGSATKGHIVQFAIREIQPVQYSEVESMIVNAASDLSGTINNAWNSVTSFFGGGNGGSIMEKLQQFTLNLEPEKSQIISTISLYMPETVNFQLSPSYNDTKSILGAFEEITGPLGKNINAARNNSAMQLAIKKAGYAVNPQIQMLFEGIGFRDYQMAFTFTPYSKQEAETVKNIIKTFRKHASPQIVTQSAGMFFVPPSVFDISFLYNGQPNPNINKIARSVITSVDVNYAPDGWSAHDDGAPVQTTLTLQFKETVLIDKNKIEQGY